MQGNTEFNNQGNLGADCAAGKVLTGCGRRIYNYIFIGKIDAILHMGDHCYNMGDNDDYRGDSYMNAFSNAVSKAS